MSAPTPTKNQAGIFQSPYLLILFFLIAAMALALFMPNQLLDAADGVSGKYRVLITKLSRFFKSDEKPDVAFMGSSLVLVPAVRCDEKQAGKGHAYDPWIYARSIPEYTKSDYFQNLLQKQLGLTLSVTNLGIASSIMSDQKALLETMVANGKKPRLVVLGIAPRDFLDNTFPVADETATRSFLKELNETSLLPEALTPQAIADSATKIQHRYQKVFAFSKAKFLEVASNTSKHPVSTEFSETPSKEERQNKLVDLETYKKLYNPPNFEMLKEQSSSLRDFLLTAKQNGISVIIVNMPLTDQNIATLDRTALREYRKSIAYLATTYNAKLVDIGNCESYSLSDFEDCCHLNSRGGKKLYNTIISTVAEDRMLKQYLALVSKKNQENSLASQPVKPAM